MERAAPLCYTDAMNVLRKRYVKKALLLGFLAAAGILAFEAFGDVFGVLGGRSPEETLRLLRAQHVLSQTVEVNGQTVTADVWRLPETSSADPLRKAAKGAGRLLTVGKVVYLFREDVRGARGDCAWPEDLPQWGVRPEYVVDAGTSRFVSGVSDETPEALRAALAAAAEAQGWKALGGNVWQRKHETLIAHAAESRRGTEAALVVQRNPR